MSIPEHIIEEIKSRSSISEIASEFVQLRRSGNNQVGLCPFHSEKTPSFHVREEAGTFHCFGCGKHGNAFTLLIELRGLTFPEAVRTLGRRLGIEVPDDQRHDSKRDDEQRKRRSLARAVSSLAADIYRQTLGGRAAPQEYLRERGLKPETLAAFGVGFAPDSRHFIFDALHKGLSEQTKGELEGPVLREIAESVGLIKRKDGSAEYYDAFRNRVIFPIQRSDGATIAFGGRILPGPDSTRAPKYLNSCEHLLYSKRQTLFGLPQAMKELRTKRHAYVVEGYMDVLGVHQAGLTNAVATCGTAVTDQHASLLRRFVERVTIVFDGDAAGEKAAAQCFEAFLNSGLDCFAVSLPEGEDPDTLARKLSPSAMQELLETQKRTLFEVYLDFLVREIAGPDAELSPTSSGKVAVKLAEIISRVKNSVEREFLLRRGAERLGATVSSLELLLSGSRSRDLPMRPKTEHPRREPAPSRLPDQVRRDSADAEAPGSGLQQRAAYAARNETPKAKPAAGEQKILKFYHQLLIAVVTSPGLTHEILRLSSLEEPERNIRMPGKLRRFFEAVDVRLKAGGGDWDAPAAGDLPEDELRTLLDAHGFPSDKIIREAQIQMNLRGYSPEAVVHAADELRERELAKQELSELRDAQKEPADPTHLLEIAQKKLEKRRALDRLGRP